MPRSELTMVRKDSLVAQQKAHPQSTQRESTRKQESAFVITDQTAVYLNGRTCRYRDVPNQAHIVSLEVAPDRKTVLKVHFQTAK
jgi:hypothetical protein